MLDFQIDEANFKLTCEASNLITIGFHIIHDKMSKHKQYFTQSLLTREMSRTSLFFLCCSHFSKIQSGRYQGNSEMMFISLVIKKHVVFHVKFLNLSGCPNHQPLGYPKPKLNYSLVSLKNKLSVFRIHLRISPLPW